MNVEYKLTDFLDETEHKFRELLYELIEEYKELKGLCEEDSVPLNIKIGNTTLVKINGELVCDDDEDRYIFRFTRQGDKIEFNIPNMLLMVNAIDELNKPYRKLLKYRVKSNEKISYTIAEVFNYEVRKEFEIEAYTLEELFIQVYKMNRHLRYCNGCYYKFKDESLEKQSHQWEKDLPHGMSFSLYYGDGIVD